MVIFPLLSENCYYFIVVERGNVLLHQNGSQIALNRNRHPGHTRNASNISAISFISNISAVSENSAHGPGEVVATTELHDEADFSDNSSDLADDIGEGHMEEEEDEEEDDDDIADEEVTGEEEESAMDASLEPLSSSTHMNEDNQMVANGTR